MLRMMRSVCLGVVLAGWLSSAVAAQDKNAPPRTVNDEAGLFGANAVRAADREIAEIKRTYNKDLLIETRKEGPPKDEYEAWAEKQAKRYRVEGVYIVITKQPRHFQVLVGNVTRQKGLFTGENVRQVQTILKAELGKNPDEALRGVVNYVDKAFRENSRANAGAATPPAAGGNAGVEHHVRPSAGGLLGGSICGLVCVVGAVLAGVWLVFAIIRAFTSRSYGGAPGGPGYGGGGGYGGPGYGGGYGGGGGGGFFSSLLGGMFGAAAGNWMYNSFFGGHSSYNPPPTYPPAGSPPSAGPTSTPEPTDASAGYSGGGGDWGGDDNGGGGDAGGGNDGGADAGGGDWGDGGGDAGGGDAGGGGDWGGGGGGDWGGGGGGDFGGGGGGGGGDW